MLYQSRTNSGSKNFQTTNNMSTTEITEVENGLPEDIFNREKIAGQMCDIIVNMKANDISPLVLDGPWGCGKSIHALRMYDVFTKKYGDKIKCLYWNASSSDYSEHPLLTFVSLLFQHVDVNKKEDFEKKGLDICLGIGLGGLTSIFRQTVTITTGIDLAKVSQDAAAGANLFKSDDKKLYESFSEMLNNLAHEKKRIEAAQVLLNLVREDKELIIIIDELDRCRPDFALNMLECIKHLFSTENCKFVLVMNKTSIASTVQKMYGLNEDSAIHYLGKYLKTDFIIPDLAFWDGNTSINCAYKYFLNIMNANHISHNATKSFLLFLTKKKGLQLRDMEKLATTYKILDKLCTASEQSSAVSNNQKPESTNELAKLDNAPKSFILVFASYLFSIKPNIAQRIASLNITPKEVLNELEWNQPVEDQHNRYYETSVFYRMLAPLLEVYLSYGEQQAKTIQKYNDFPHQLDLHYLLRLFSHCMMCGSFMRLS